MGRIVFLCSLLLWTLSPLLYAPPARAEIYRWVDKQGIVHFTDAPTNSRYGAVPGTAARKVPGNADRRLRSDRADSRINGLIQKISRENDLDPKLVRAVVRVESNYNPRAVSHKGAQGLMQLMPKTAERFGVPDPFDAEENIRGGVHYLKYLLQRFGGNIRLALAAYNAGEESVERHGGVPPYRETTGYLEKILRYYTAPALTIPTRIYRIVNGDGSILFTNTPR